MDTHDDNRIVQNIQDTVLHKVEGGTVHARSHAFFVVRLVGTIAVAVLAFLLSTFVASFILFSIHESGEQFLLGFGSAGIITFFELFPWIPFVVDIAVLILLEWLLQGFRLGYRFSLIVIFIGVFGGSALLGFLIDLTPLHSTLLGLANKGELPVVGGVYESVRDCHASQGVFRGVIMALGPGAVILAHQDSDHDGDDGVWKVTVPPGAGQFYIGEHVYVFGPLEHGVIEAQGIEPLPTDGF